MARPTLLLFAFAIYRAALAPDDYQQGATVKIMFLHVPSAWLGMLCWALMTVAALGTLVWRHPLADVAAKAAAPLGAAFTLLCLVTGSLWGRPEWVPPIDREFDDRQIDGADEGEDRHSARGARRVLDRAPKPQ